MEYGNLIYSKFRTEASYNFTGSNTVSNMEMSHINLFTNVNSNVLVFCFQWWIRIPEWTEVPCWIQDPNQSRHRTSPHQDERPSYQ